MDPITCPSLPGVSSITMTNATGLGYGSQFESDPNNLVTWYNEASHSCVWNGNIDSDWLNPGHWTDCNNGRNNYPDQFDDISIPSGLLTLPIVSSNVVIKSVTDRETPGESGGTITINSGARLWIGGMELKSDLTIIGNPSTCFDCVLAFEELSILKGATLNLEKGIKVRQRGGEYAFLVGDGVTSGHLIINPNSSNQSEWPTILPLDYYNGGILVEGDNATNRSSVFINGLKSLMHNQDNDVITLVDFYEVKNFDNYIIDSAFNWEMASPRIQINNCANSLFTDTSWNQIDFMDSQNEDFPMAFNITFTNCTGASVGPIDITKMTGEVNLGFRAELANDPGNFLIWNP